MPAEKISTENAKQDKLFYFVANVHIYRESDGRFLLLKRSAREKVHPGKYCNPGGKMEWQDLDLASPTRMNGEVYDFENAVEKLLAKEVKEEAGLEIDTKNLIYINSVAFVRPDGIPVVLVKFAAEYKSGEVDIDKNDFDDFIWVNNDEVKNYDCILGIAEEIDKTNKLLQS
jgi:8-oxo-dGTP pyrophosphatase MutT (NUDIX family)